MRFATAATILSHTFSHNEGVRTMNRHSPMTQQLKHQHRVRSEQLLRHPPSNLRTTTIGRLSSSLRNSNGQAQASDPLVCDPDVGVLSCGSGQYCQPIDTSRLGGVCVPDLHSNSRHLFTAGLCNPDSTFYQLYYCDCSDFDVSSGDGSITCVVAEGYSAGYYYEGCDDTIYDITASYSFEGSALISSQECFVFNQPYYQKVCVNLTTENCQVEFNDETCLSCLPISEDYFEFDCSNVQGGQSGSMEDGLLDFFPIIGECYDAPTGTCSSLCLDDTYIPSQRFNTTVDIPGYWEVTCQNLAFADYYGLVPDYLCEPSQEAAQSVCCVSACPLCETQGHVPTENYDVVVSTTTIPGFDGKTCADFVAASYTQFLWSAEECPQVQSVANEFCCTLPTASPTSAPCDICGDLILLHPAQNVSVSSLEVSCADLEIVAKAGSLNAEQCLEAMEIAAGVCCGEDFGDIGTESPHTDAPATETPSGHPTPAPTTETPSHHPTLAPTLLEMSSSPSFSEVPTLNATNSPSSNPTENSHDNQTTTLEPTASPTISPTTTSAAFKSDSMHLLLWTGIPLLLLLWGST